MTLLQKPRRRRWRTVGALSGVLVVVLVVTTVATSSGCATFGGVPEGARQERNAKDPQWKDGHFTNVEETKVMVGEIWPTTKEFLFGNGNLVVPNCVLPLVDPAEQLALAPPTGLRVTWLGHATTLVELDGARILTDPMWSERASPVTIAGPKRFHPPPLALEKVPKVDAIVVSHDHYDHLDMATVQHFAALGVPFHVGLGVGAHLERWGVPAAQIHEHAWWEPFTLPNGVQVVSVPSRHFSGRLPWREALTQWTSWALVGPTHRVFFSGDTGLHEQLKTIGEKLGPFDLSLLEIGQWHPAWGQIHLGPKGALEAHQRLGAKALVPIHWATFELGLHAWSEPVETLVTEGRLQNATVLTPKLGEPVEPGGTDLTRPWWRSYPPTTDACPSDAKVEARRTAADWPM